MKYNLTIISLILFFSIPGTAVGAPTGSDLYAACQYSLENGFDSIQGQMCTWYVIPCDCSIEKALPKVCAPENLSTNELASIVIDGLFENEFLMNETAEYSAAMILSKAFPCNIPPGIDKLPQTENEN